MVKGEHSQVVLPELLLRKFFPYCFAAGTADLIPLKRSAPVTDDGTGKSTVRRRFFLRRWLPWHFHFGSAPGVRKKQL
jgi:hypothetical protein